MLLGTHRSGFIIFDFVHIRAHTRTHLFNSNSRQTRDRGVTGDRERDRQARDKREKDCFEFISFLYFINDLFWRANPLNK